MTKAELVAKLEVVKDHSPVVSIDKMIELIQQLEAEVRVERVFGITDELAETIASKIEMVLDNHQDDLADCDSAEFELNYDNRIELSSVNINVYDIMEHITKCLETFVAPIEMDITE